MNLPQRWASISQRWPQTRHDFDETADRGSRVGYVLFLGAVLLGSIGLAAAATASSSTVDKPLPTDLSVVKLPPPAESSHILARDGTELAVLFGDENRRVVDLDHISQTMQQSVIGVEDRRFFNHKGVDLKGVFRAAATNFQSGSAKQGGSTLTQQYVRNTYLARSKTLGRKFQEILISLAVERTHTKKEILAAYLNTAYFGEGSYGVEAAAQTYFGIDASRLDAAQSALLVALLPSPNDYSPGVNPKLAKQRRDKVLHEMGIAGVIGSAEADRLANTPLGVITRKTTEVKLAPYFVEFVKQRLLDDPRLGKTPGERFDSLFRGGLSIRTTLDPRLQKVADDAATRLPRGVPEAAAVLMNPIDGDILAYHGGNDFNQNKFDLVAQSHRQPGSSFKTFALTAALLQHYSPDLIISGHSPCVFQISKFDKWTVHNFANEQFGSIPLRNALAHSVNCAFANLIMQYIRPEDAMDAAKKMGISSTLDPNPAIAIGGIRVGVNPLEMARAYGTLAAEGRRPEVRPILEVDDRNGKVLFADKARSEQVLPQNVARAATDVLEGVITNGTGRRANIGRPAAGKTGTTQAHRDAWFIGYTPQLVSAVWIGHREGLIAMNDVTGGSVPAGIWRTIMLEATRNLPVLDFRPPDLSEFDRTEPGASPGAKPRLRRPVLPTAPPTVPIDPGPSVPQPAPSLPASPTVSPSPQPAPSPSDKKPSPSPSA